MRWKPVMEVFEQIVSASGSIMRLNIEGDKGQPCLVPFVIKGWRSKLVRRGWLMT